MKRKSVFIGMVLLALLLTTGTFAYTYSNTSTLTINGTIADAAMTTYQPAAGQPHWDTVLPQGIYNSEILRPDAVGADTELPTQYPNEGEHWDKVDDETADESSTYVSTLFSRHWERDLYSLSGFTGVGGMETITNVTVYYRIAAAGTYDIRAMAAILTNGQVYEGPTETHFGNAFTTFSHNWEFNPATNEAWTWEGINELQAGLTVRGKSRFNPALCTQVYVVVDYNYVIIEGSVPVGELYDVTPHPDYTGDLMLKMYLLNTADLLKAYQYLNMKVYVANSVEAEETPDFQVLSIENGLVMFNIEGGSADDYTIKIIGGGYRLVSGDTSEWGEGWSVTPEFYLEITQR